MEAPPGFEPGLRVLQTLALPLGYSAVFRFCEYATTNHENEKFSAPAIAGAGTAYSQLPENIPFQSK